MKIRSSILALTVSAGLAVTALVGTASAGTGNDDDVQRLRTALDKAQIQIQQDQQVIARKNERIERLQDRLRFANARPGDSVLVRR